MTEKEVQDYLESIGATAIQSYSLVNNYGFVFTYNKIRYDLRYWANSYGCPLNRWILSYDFYANNFEIDFKRELEEHVNN